MTPVEMDLAAEQVERERKIARVHKLLEMKIPITEIGWRIGGLSTAEVRELLAEPMLDDTARMAQPGSPWGYVQDGVHPMWKLPEEERRRLFIERARQGARATLQSHARRDAGLIAPAGWPMLQQMEMHHG